MASRNPTFVMAAWLCISLWRCGSSSPVPGSDQIGDSLSFVTSSYVQGPAGSDLVYAYDHYVQRFHQFDLSTPAIMASFSVRESKTHHILSSASGAYLVDVSEEHVDLVVPGQASQTDVLHLSGKPATSAAIPSEGIYVIVDELKSIGCLLVDDNGTVTGSFVGGAKLGALDTVLAGDLLPGGKLVVSLSDQSFAIIDVKQSVTQQQWVFDTMPGVSETIDWVSRIPDASNRFVATTATQIVVMDISTQTVVSQTALDKTLVARFRNAQPHLYASDGTNLFLYTIDPAGQVSSQILAGSITAVSDSTLDQDRSHITIVQQDLSPDELGFAYPKIFRIRLSDSLVVSKKDPIGRSRVGITSNYMLFQYESALGFAERYAFDTDATAHVMEGFNIPYLWD